MTPSGILYLGVRGVCGERGDGAVRGGGPVVALALLGRGASGVGRARLARGGGEGRGDAHERQHQERAGRARGGRHRGRSRGADRARARRDLPRVERIVASKRASKKRSTPFLTTARAYVFEAHFRRDRASNCFGGFGLAEGFFMEAVLRDA